MSDETTDYEQDYYDPEQQAAQGMGRQHMVFRDDVRVRFPANGDNDRTILYVQPAFPRQIDEKREGWSWYRYPASHADFPGKFTPWTRAYGVYEWVGGKVSILDPRSVWPDIKTNPVQILLDTVKANPDWRHLAGIGPDGKKFKDKKERMAKIIDNARQNFVVNAVNRSKVDEKENNLSCLYVCARGAIAGPNRPGKNSTWGLFAQLNMLARNVSEAEIAKDFTKKWHWGDITRADGQFPIEIRKDDGPTGGSAKLWNCSPYENGELIPAPFLNGGYPWLNSRVPLSAPREVFIDYDAKEVIDVLQDIFGGEPKILIKAFESTIPGFRENLLKATGVISQSTVHQPGAVPSSPPAPGPSSPPPPQPTSGSFAPPPTAPPPGAAPTPPPAAETPQPPPPPAVREFWATIGGETKKLTEPDLQAMVNRGENPSMMNLDQSGGWKKPVDFGIVAAAPAQPTPPAPPAAPTTPPPPPPEPAAPATPAAPAAVPTQPQSSVPVPAAPPAPTPEPETSSSPTPPAAAVQQASGKEHLATSAAELAAQFAREQAPSTPQPPPGPAEA